MKRTTFSSILGLAAFMVSLFLTMPARAVDEVIEIRAATMHPAQHRLTEDAFVRYGNEVEKRTQGKVKFKWFLGGSLVQWDQAQKAVTGGLVDMVLGLPIYLNESIYPVTATMQSLFLCDSSAHFAATAYRAYEVIPEMKKEYEGYKVLAFFSTANVNIHTKGSPPKTLGDLQGLKIFAGSANAVELLKSWGASPQFLRPRMCTWPSRVAWWRQPSSPTPRSGRSS